MQRLDVRSQAPGFLEPVKFYHGRRIYQPGEENETRGERMSQFFGLTWQTKLHQPSSVDSLWMATGM